MGRGTHEIRWNPLIGGWVIVAGHREKRPWRPTEKGEKPACPFCPGAPETAPYGDWDVLVLPNKYPALVPDPSPPSPVDVDGIYNVMPAMGYCRVLIETPKHTGDLHDLSLEHMVKVVEKYREEYIKLSKIDFVSYVAIFRNKGKEIGVSLIHPHSQIYALPFIPPRIQVELKNFKKFYNKEKRCLLCRIIESEKKLGKRIIYENEGFIVIHPYYAMWPYELHVYPKRHVTGIDMLDNDEIKQLADALRMTTAIYENLYDRDMPYMMVMHNRPSEPEDYSYYHFHIEFYQPYREKDKLKYRAGIETGFWVFTYDGDPVKKRQELRIACKKAVDKIEHIGECIE